jgi:hypothetical protein
MEEATLRHAGQNFDLHAGWATITPRSFGTEILSLHIANLHQEHDSGDQDLPSWDEARRYARADQPHHSETQQTNGEAKVGRTD